MAFDEQVNIPVGDESTLIKILVISSTNRSNFHVCSHEVVHLQLIFLIQEGSKGRRLHCRTSLDARTRVVVMLRGYQSKGELGPEQQVSSISNFEPGCIVCRRGNAEKNSKWPFLLGIFSPVITVLNSKSVSSFCQPRPGGVPKCEPS